MQVHIDYCSQLHKPGTVQGMMAIEKLFFDFSAKIPEVRAENYWNRLKKLKMLSQERRMERYRVLYIWKIIEITYKFQSGSQSELSGICAFQWAQPLQIFLTCLWFGYACLIIVEVLSFVVTMMNIMCPCFLRLYKM